MYLFQVAHKRENSQTKGVTVLLYVLSSVNLFLSYRILSRLFLQFVQQVFPSKFFSFHCLMSKSWMDLLVPLSLFFYGRRDEGTSQSLPWPNRGQNSLKTVESLERCYQHALVVKLVLILRAGLSTVGPSSRHILALNVGWGTRVAKCMFTT